MYQNINIIVLGLIFLKYASDTFMEKQRELMEDDPGFAEDRDEYLAEGTFWVLEIARLNYIAERAKQSDIGQVIDAALDSIEKENETLIGVLTIIIQDQNQIKEFQKKQLIYSLI